MRIFKVQGTRPVRPGHPGGHKVQGSHKAQGARRKKEPRIKALILGFLLAAGIPLFGLLSAFFSESNFE
jgi:hypothetical protein